jgi:hypothetical protein
MPTPIEKLQNEIAEEGSFIYTLRIDLEWDWKAFRRLTRVLYDVAEANRGNQKVDLSVAHAFWFFDTWVRDHTSHPNFPRPEYGYEDAIMLLDHLAYFFFMGESPFKDDTLKKLSYA